MPLAHHALGSDQSGRQHHFVGDQAGRAVPVPPAPAPATPPTPASPPEEGSSLVHELTSTAAANVNGTLLLDTVAIESAPHRVLHEKLHLTRLPISGHLSSGFPASPSWEGAR